MAKTLSQLSLFAKTINWKLKHKMQVDSFDFYSPTLGFSILMCKIHKVNQLNSWGQKAVENYQVSIQYFTVFYEWKYGANGGVLTYKVGRIEQ